MLYAFQWLRVDGIFDSLNRLLFGESLLSSLGKLPMLIHHSELTACEPIGEQHRQQRKMLNPGKLNGHLLSSPRDLWS